MRKVLLRSGVPYLLASSFVGRLPSSMTALALVRLIVGGILLFGASGNVLGMAGVGLLGTVVFAAHPRLRRTDPVAPSGAHGSPLARGAFRQQSRPTPVGG